MKFTTLDRIREKEPCQGSWRKLLRHLGKTESDNEPLPYSVILESNGLEDAVWCCTVEKQYDPEWRMFAVWCARQVEHLMTDTRSIAALDVAEAFARGVATREELDAARDAARDAAWAAARTSAGGAARDAACAAARAAAGGAAGGAARAAACAAARAAAWDAARDAQTEEFRKMVSVESYYK